MEEQRMEEYMERIRVLDALEQQAMGISRMLTTYTDRLQERLDQRVQIEEATQDVTLASINNLKAAVEKSLDQKQSLVEKCVALDKEMAGVQVINKQIQEIKQLLDVFEYAKRKR